MPQKSKTPAARPAIVGKGKPSSKNSKVKAVKAAILGAGTKVMAKLTAKSTKPQNSSKGTPTGKSAVRAAGSVEKTPPQQIEKAKAALKKEKVAVVAAEPAAKPTMMAKVPTGTKLATKPATRPMPSAPKSGAKNAAAAPTTGGAVAAPAPAPPTKPMSKARARKLGIEISANEAASALAAKWALLFKKADQIESKPYNMKAAFEEKTAIVHKVLGWGYILADRNDRLEVLFKDGIKYLISNYKL